MWLKNTITQMVCKTDIISTIVDFVKRSNSLEGL